MERSRLTVVGRHAVVWVAATLAVGASLNAAAVGNKGIIHLVTNNSTGVAEFRLQDPDGNISQYQQFNIQQGTKCIVDDDNYANWSAKDPSWSYGPGSLVDVHAAISDYPYLFKGDNSGVGLIGGSIGVFNNSNGTSCGRITGALGESLTLTPQIAGFDKLSLDIEAKGSAVFVLQIDPPNGDRYYLYTGNNAALVDTPDAHHQVCSNGSDSGPDSGPNDNCRWNIEAPGGSFTLSVDSGADTTGVNGEGSLEGGGDEVDAGWGDWATYSTKLYLTSLIDVGYLGCNSNDTPDNMTAKVYSDEQLWDAASCQVTRINPNSFLTDPESPYKCTSPIGYKLETFKAASLCALDKTGSVREQLASSMQVTFPPEPREAWDGVRQTEIQFKDEFGQPVASFKAERCGGTVVEDNNGNPTIKEVLLGTLTGKISAAAGGFVYEACDPNSDADCTVLTRANDLVSTNKYIDWACILDNREVILSNDKMQVTQTILFWGDIAFSRN